jgi:hypothetical protein
MSCPDLNSDSQTTYAVLQSLYQLSYSGFKFTNRKQVYPWLFLSYLTKTLKYSVVKKRKRGERILGLNVSKVNATNAENLTLSFSFRIVGP